MGTTHLKFSIQPETFLTHLAEAAVKSALKQRQAASPSMIQTMIRRALREVIRQDMFVSDTCGLMTVCQEAGHYEPWSEEAVKIYQDLGD